jgi:LysM repeat protein
MPRTCPPGTFPYSVRRNDTLFRISRRFNVSIPAILAVNPDINLFSILRVDDVICIPGRQPEPGPGLPGPGPGPGPGPPTGPRPPTGPAPGPGRFCPDGFIHRVRPGETLDRIAAYYNVRLIDLLRANPGIFPNRLFIGQSICIPRPAAPRCPPNTFEYIIRSGDTLGSLARRFGTTVREIMRLNPGINPFSMRVGQRICIPRPVPR